MPTTKREQTQLNGVQMKNECNIPRSTASRNVMLCIVMLGITGVFGSLSLPIWLIFISSVIAAGLLLATIYCILDIQEYKMKQNQQLIELLHKVLASKIFKQKEKQT